MSDVPAELAARYPDGKVRVEQGVIHAMLHAGDAWFPVRARVSPFAEVFVALRPMDDFELEIKWTDRFRDPDVGDPVFDDAFGLTTNDVELMRMWLDAPARAALLGSPYAYVDAILVDIVGP